MSKELKTGVLLVNLGTPDSPSVPDVRKYLREFLWDERVLDIPAVPRWLLVNLLLLHLGHLNRPRYIENCGQKTVLHLRFTA